MLSSSTALLMKRNLKRKEMMDDSYVSPVMLKKIPECQDTKKWVHQRTLDLLGQGANIKPPPPNACYFCSAPMNLSPCPCCEHPTCLSCTKTCNVCDRIICLQCIDMRYDGPSESAICWECCRSSS